MGISKKKGLKSSDSKGSSNLGVSIFRLLVAGRGRPCGALGVGCGGRRRAAASPAHRGLNPSRRAPDSCVGCLNTHDTTSCPAGLISHTHAPPARTHLLCTFATRSAPSVLDQLAASLTPHLLTLADVTDSAGDAVAAAAEAAPGGGVMDTLAGGFEAFLKVLDNGLVQLGVPYSYGFAIILLTCLVKAATYPLSKKQVESTVAMQALQPRVKDLQSRFADNPEKLQMETARLYKEAGVNPLAGCLPTLATIPVWIGLYKCGRGGAGWGLPRAVWGLPLHDSARGGCCSGRARAMHIPSHSRAFHNLALVQRPTYPRAGRCPTWPTRAC